MERERGPKRACLWSVQGIIGAAACIWLCALVLTVSIGVRPVSAAAPTCLATAPDSCTVGICLPGSVCVAQGGACTCLATCGDFPSCGTGKCLIGTVCTNVGTTCACVPVATATPTVTPTPIPATPARVPAASSGGLLIAVLLLAVVGAVTLGHRALKSSE